MKKIIAVLLSVIFIVTLFPIGTVSADDDCKGRCPTVVSTPHCGNVGQIGLKLCIRETTVSQSDKKGEGQGAWSGRQSIPTLFQASEPKPTVYMPEPFHKRNIDCVKTLTCKVFYGNGKAQ